jgi:hypothetical protein
VNDDPGGAGAASADGSRRGHRTVAGYGERRLVASATDSPGHFARREEPDSRRGVSRRCWTGLPSLELALAAAAFAVLCIAVLTAAPRLAEPDDYAYRASIVAITDGHFLTLSTGQVRALAAQLTRSAGPGRRVLTDPGPLGGSIEQWVRLPGGRWFSEKNPGYPFLAAPFQALGIIRLAPLFYGALGCLGLFFGARRWLGRFGGTAAVALFCSSGAAFLFAWRDYMPTFTEAALIAAGSGALLWAVLAEDASARRRTASGLLGFLAIEAAVFVRYTNIVVFCCALAAVLAARWLRAASVPRGAVWWWGGSAALFGAGVAAFDDAAYGGLLRSGYRPGEIIFRLGAVPANLRLMPAHLIQAMPMLVLGLAAAAWIAVRRVRLRRTGGEQRRGARRDFAVGTALAASWFGTWGVYAAYAWTTQPGLSSLQTARFYVPATGAIALLGAWLLVRGRRTRSATGLPPLTATATAAVIVALAGLGLWSFHDMLAAQHSGSPPPQCNIGEPHCPAKPPSHGQSHGSR